MKEKFFSKKVFILIFSAILVFVLGILGTGCSSLNNQSSTTPPSSPQITQPSLGAATFNTTTQRQEMATSLLGAFATVQIINNATGTRQGFGSGIAVAENGYLLTNYHVISKVASSPLNYSINLEMMINNDLKNNVKASLLWYNASLDMAILKSEVNFKTYAQMSNRWINSANPLKISEEVWTLGTPANITLWGTYSEGTISSNLPRVQLTQVDDNYYLHNYLIQHSAAISNGNSGGPLFDSNGYLIGLNTCGVPSTSSVTATNLFFAVPIYPATIVLNKVISGFTSSTPYKTPLLGVSGVDKDHKLINTNQTFEGLGFNITALSQEGAAEKAQIPVGASIIGIANSFATSQNDPSYYEIKRSYDLSYALLHYAPSDQITVFYEYNQQINHVVVELQ